VGLDDGDDVSGLASAWCSVGGPDVGSRAVGSGEGLSAACVVKMSPEKSSPSVAVGAARNGAGKGEAVACAGSERSMRAGMRQR
jgi:hypothetical protein